MKGILVVVVLVAAISLAGCGLMKNRKNVTTVKKFSNGTTVVTVTTPQGRVLSIKSDGPI